MGRRPAVEQRPSRNLRLIVSRRDNTPSGHRRAATPEAVLAYLTGANYHDGWVYSDGAFELGFNVWWILYLATDTVTRLNRSGTRESTQPPGSAARRNRSRPVRKRLKADGNRPVHAQPPIRHEVVRRSGRDTESRRRVEVPQTPSAATGSTGDRNGRLGLFVSEEYEPLIWEFLSYKKEHAGKSVANDHCVDALQLPDGCRRAVSPTPWWSVPIMLRHDASRGRPHIRTARTRHDTSTSAVLVVRRRGPLRAVAVVRVTAVDTEGCSQSRDCGYATTAADASVDKWL